MKKLFRVFSRLPLSSGFTMIELLIVIAILGILAVAILSAINPVEQINRGRDTGSRSDAEQLLSAIDRYNAFQGYYPWQADPTEDTDLTWGALHDDSDDILDSDGCYVREKLSSIEDSPAGCNGSDELKVTFFNRITDTSYNPLYLYNNGDLGDSTYVCFVPKSKAFRQEAKDRCEDAAGSGLPSDVDGAVAATICGGYTDDDVDVYVCLP